MPSRPLILTLCPSWALTGEAAAGHGQPWSGWAHWCIAAYSDFHVQRLCSSLWGWSKGSLALGPWGLLAPGRHGPPRGTSCPLMAALPNPACCRMPVKPQPLLDFEAGGVTGRGFKQYIGVRWMDYKWVGYTPDKLYRWVQHRLLAQRGKPQCACHSPGCHELGQCTISTYMARQSAGYNVHLSLAIPAAGL
jgi:hypothetical protein